MNARITLGELAELIAESASTSKRVSELFLREFIAVVSQALIDGESVKVKGIGTFKVTKVKSRKSVSVSTGDEIEIAGYSKLTFTPDKSFADAVNQPFAQFETVVLDDEVTDEKLAEIDKQYPSLFEDMSTMPEPPDDLPEPPTPSLDDLPEAVVPTVAKHVVKEPQAPVVQGPEPSQGEPEPVKPAIATPIEKPSVDETASRVSPAAPVAKPIVNTPLMGIPIDGPSERPKQEQPAKPEPKSEPEPEPEPEDDFRRPEPRNAYTPTPEQIERHNKPDRKRWLWIALAALVAGALLWLWLSPSGKSDEPVPEAVVVDSDSTAGVVETAPAKKAADDTVITDIVTSKIVLSTLSEKYYNSPWFWVYIYEENKSIISDPNNVKPGTSVVIPPAEKYGIDAKDPASLKRAQRRSWEILKGK